METLLDTLTSLPRRSHAELLQEHVPLKGAFVVDVGCGEGRFTRMMAGLGAKVMGVDPGPQQIERALVGPAAPGARYALGSAERLDVATGEADAVVYFNSLHHVPEALMDRALAEAARVLKAGGVLYVAEPLAQGPQFELQQPVNDESEIRARAYEAIGRASQHGFAPAGETRYVTDSKYASYEAYRDNSIAVNPARAPLYVEKDAEMRARFAKFGEQQADGWHFPQAMRVNVLKKI